MKRTWWRLKTSITAKLASVRFLSFVSEPVNKLQAPGAQKTRNTIQVQAKNAVFVQKNNLITLGCCKGAWYMEQT